MNESWTFVFYGWPSRLSKHPRFQARIVSGRVQSNRLSMFLHREMAEQLVETLKNVSWDRIKQRTVEHIGDIPVSQVMKESTEISTGRGSSAFCGTDY